jgi:hypothetical protein
MKPRRVQLSRRKGFDLQAESKKLNGLPAKRVTRPGKWGAKTYHLDPEAAQAKAVELCGLWLRGRLDKKLSPADPPSRAEMREELAGHNLACWCRPGTPCHTEVLIELANS